MHHLISPLWARTTWNSWMRSRFVACESSIRSASPRVPTVENARSRRSAAKSSHAATNSRLWAARSLVGQPAPGRVDLQERVLDEVTLGHARREDEARVKKPEGRVARTGTVVPLFRMARMRVALVSPYSWTYPGGVNRHIEALAAQLLAPAATTCGCSRPRRGHRAHRAAASRRAPAAARDAGVARPARPHDRLGRPTAPSRTSRRTPSRSSRRCGASCARATSTSCTCTSPSRRSIGWEALTSADAPLVGTFHCYSESVPPHSSPRCSAPGASSTASPRGSRCPTPPPGPAGASTAASYRVVPNGVDAARGRRARAARARGPGEPLEIVFVGQAVERKGLPILLRAFEALRAQVPAAHDRRRLRAPRSPRCWSTATGVTVLGRVSDERASAPRSSRAPTCSRAPSLGGESFGMVLTEAFAAGTPVVASDIAGYRDVVRDGVDGAARARAATRRALAEPLRDLALEPGAHGRARRRRRRERRALRLAAGRRAGRARPTRTRSRCREPAGAMRRAAVRIGMRSADLRPAPPGAPDAVARAARRRARPAPARAAPRRAGRGALAAVAGSYLALDRIGVDRIGRSLLDSSPAWVLARARAHVRCRWASAPSPGTRSSRPRCRRCGRGSPTPGRARRSAC